MLPADGTRPQDLWDGSGERAHAPDAGVRPAPPVPLPYPMNPSQRRNSVMMAVAPNRLTPPLVLKARTAADLMTPDPKSVRQDATVAEAVAFLTGRGFGAAPVIDEAGR